MEIGFQILCLLVTIVMIISFLIVFNQDENMANNDANQDDQDLDSLALRGLKRLVCISIWLGVGMIVTGTAQTEEEQVVLGLDCVCTKSSV